MLQPLIWVVALGAARADFRPNLWFNFTLPSSSPVIYYLPESNATFTRWNTSFADSDPDPDKYVPGALGKGASSTSIDVSGYDEAVLNAPFTGVWFLGTAEDTVDARKISVDGNGAQENGTTLFTELVGADRVLASTTGHDFGLHEARMNGKGTGVMSVQEVMFTTGIMSNASSWSEALAAAKIVPVVVNGQPNSQATLHNNARAGGTWNVSTTLGPPEDQMMIDTLHGTHGVTFRMPIPANTTLVILNGTFGPSHTVIWVVYTPPPPFIAREERNENASRLSTFNKWTGTGALYLQHLDPAVQYTVTVRAGEESEGQGLHSFICVPGSADATTATVDNSNAGTLGNLDKPPASTDSGPQAAVNHSRTNVGAIAGGVVGGVLGLLLILAAVFFLVRRRRRNEVQSPKAVHQIDLVHDGPPSEEKGLASLVSPYTSPYASPDATAKANSNIGAGSVPGGQPPTPTEGSSVSAEPVVPLEPLSDRAYLNSIGGHHNTLLSPGAGRPSPWGGEMPRNPPPLAAGLPRLKKELLASPTRLGAGEGQSGIRVVEHAEDAEEAGLVVGDRELLPPMYRSEWAARQGPPQTYKG